VDNINLKNYYGNVEISNNIINAMRFRANAFLNVTNDFKFNVHNIVVNSTDHILKNMYRFYFYERRYNLYSSVARYDFSRLNSEHKIPPFSFNLEKRKKQGELFNKINDEYVFGYDFVLDFDVKESYEKTYNDVKLIKNQYDVYGVPYILRFTGSGFHIIVPYKYLPDWDIVSYPDKLRKIALSLKNIYDINSLDLGIYDLRRVIKTAYSVDMKTGYVCLPLSDIEFERFNPEYARPSNIIRMPDLYFRNSLIRQGTKLEFLKFIMERIGW